MNNVEKVIKAFEEKPYKIKNSARLQAKRLNVSVEDVREAKRIIYGNNYFKHQPKILILDIETTPMKAWVWSRWKENVYLDQTMQEWFMLSFSAKWLNEDNIIGEILTPEEIKEENDYRILIELYKLLDEADIVIAHNGNKFDIPKINTRFILNNINQPSHYIQIDTLYVAKKQFGFSSNSLDALATFFGFSNKDPHDFKLWRDCMNGSIEALEKMLKYNKKDVEILEKIYLKLRPWIKNHPNINVISESEKPCCTKCGSINIEYTDKEYCTQHYKYSMFRCKDCGATFRSKIRFTKKSSLTSF